MATLLCFDCVSLWIFYLGLLGLGFQGLLYWFFSALIVFLGNSCWVIELFIWVCLVWLGFFNGGFLCCVSSLYVACRSLHVSGMRERPPSEIVNVSDTKETESVGQTKATMQQWWCWLFLKWLDFIFLWVQYPQSDELLSRFRALRGLFQLQRTLLISGLLWRQWVLTLRIQALPNESQAKAHESSCPFW